MATQESQTPKGMIRKLVRTLTATLLVAGGTFLPAVAQEPDQTQDRDRVQAQDQDRLQTQERDQLGQRIRDLEQQQKQDRDRLNTAIQQHGKNSPQAQEARGQLERTREQVRATKREMKQVQTQASEQERMQRRERIHEPGTGLGTPGAGGGMGSPGSGGGTRAGGRGGRGPGI